jgi:hypothetical protein
MVKQNKRAVQRTLSASSKLWTPGMLSRDDERLNSMTVPLVDATVYGGCCIPVSPTSASMSLHT